MPAHRRIAAGLIMAILGAHAVWTVGGLFWGSDAVATGELNPKLVAVPFLPASCDRWADSFVLVKLRSDGTALYRCGPGFGYVRAWPFTDTWTGPWPFDHVGSLAR